MSRLLDVLLAAILPVTGSLTVPASAPALISHAAAPPAAPPAAQPIRLEKPSPGDLQSACFEVPDALEVRIVSVGLLPRRAEEYLAMAWLLEERTRRAVWAMDERTREPTAESRLLRRGDDVVRLAPGCYVLYQWAGRDWREEIPFQHVSNVLNDLADLLSGENRQLDSRLAEYLAQCFVELSPAAPPEAKSTAGPAADARATGTFPWRPCPPVPDAGAAGRGASAQAGVLFVHTTSDDTLVQQPFRLVRPTALRVHAVGEVNHRGDTLLDYGWIESAATAEPVWRMTADSTQTAGGSRRNRLVDAALSLAAGDYVACFLTDGAHGPRHWRFAPPRDPEAWGLTITADNGSRPGDLQAITPAQVRVSPALLVDWRAVGNDQHRRQTFRIERPARVRVVALGEGGRDEMYDHGWIVSQASGETIWSMSWRDTQPAGGSTKNRLFRGDLLLGPGRYEAHFVTDGSHAFGGWNAPAPRDPHLWGMTVRIVETP